DKNFLKQTCFIIRPIHCVGAAISSLRQKYRGNSRIESMGEIVKHFRLSFLAVCIGLLALGSVAFAHHGTANYDTSKSITVKGVVTGFDFVNPHVQIFWE